MADVDFQISQLVSLAIGSPEVGAVNFNLLQKVLLEILKLTDIDNATVSLSAVDAAKLEDTYSVTPLPIDEEDQKQDEYNNGSLRKSRGSHQCPIDPEKVDHLLEDVNQLKFDLEDLTGKVAAMSTATDTVPFQEMRNSISQIDNLQEKIKHVESLLENVKDLDLDGSEERSLGQRLSYLEKHVESHSDQLTKVNSILDDKLNGIMDQFADMEKELGVINEKMNIAASSTQLMTKKSLAESRISSVQDQSSSINNIISRLSSIQQDLDNLTVVTNNLTEDQEQRQMVIDVLTEQIDVLKLVKADKNNMEDILAAKADMSQVHRKVSHDHFENKIEQLNALVEDAFNRLDAHEEMWQDEVEDLKTDIENKLDKMEFSPLRDYVNEKLKMLQDRMKVFATQKREGVAAGSQRKVIMDVQCISCDNDSVMMPANTLEDVMPPPPLPSQQSVRPYLTYKLDQVRKQQKKLPTGRNLLHFEEMLHDSSDTKNRKVVHNGSRGGGGEHLVNRYVGGSHTTTTPQQRITRTGNFFETWGPVITAVNNSHQSLV